MTNDKKRMTKCKRVHFFLNALTKWKLKLWKIRRAAIWNSSSARWSCECSPAGDCKYNYRLCIKKQM